MRETPTARELSQQLDNGHRVRRDKDAYPRWIGQPFESLREVAPGMYVGSWFCLAYARPWDTIVDFHGSSLDPEYTDGYETARVVVSVPIEDGEAIPWKVLDKAWAACVNAQGPVLFHCAMGISRSVSAMSAMLLRSGYYDEAEAAKHVRFGRPLKHTYASAVAWSQEMRKRDQRK